MLKNPNEIDYSRILRDVGRQGTVNFNWGIYPFGTLPNNIVETFENDKGTVTVLPGEKHHDIQIKVSPGDLLHDF